MPWSLWAGCRRVRGRLGPDCPPLPFEAFTPPPGIQALAQAVAQPITPPPGIFFWRGGLTLTGPPPGFSIPQPRTPTGYPPGFFIPRTPTGAGFFIPQTPIGAHPTSPGIPRTSPATPVTAQSDTELDASDGSVDVWNLHLMSKEQITDLWHKTQERRHEWKVRADKAEKKLNKARRKFLVKVEKNRHCNRELDKVDNLMRELNKEIVKMGTMPRTMT